MANSGYRTFVHAMSVSTLSLLAACGGGGGGGGDGSDTVRDDDPSSFAGRNFSFTLDEGAFGGQASQGFIDNANAFYPQVLAPLNAIPGLLDATVQVTYTDCGVANAFYNPSERSVTLCSELDEEQYQVLLATGLEPPEAAAQSDFVMAFVLNHEIGHALIDILDLPAIGNAESAADAISTVLSVEQSIGTDFVPYSLIGGLAVQSQPNSYGGEHPGGEDRTGDILCWTVGGRTQLLFDPQFAALVSPFVEAGRDCVAEYQDQLSTVRRWLPGYGGTELAERPLDETTLAGVAALIASSKTRGASNKGGNVAPKMSLPR